MSNKNTFVQADNIFNLNNESNITPKVFSLDSELGGRPLPYPYDSFASVVMAVNPVIESLSINLNTILSSTKTFLSRSGYVTDNNSTTVLKPVDDSDIWIQKESKQLLSLLRTEDIESGIASPSEIFAKRALKENRVLALQMINQVYLDNVGNTQIQIGILNLCSHIDYNIGSPVLPTIALAALNDRDDDVRDYGVRCYEYWNNRDGLRILRTIRTDTVWLQNCISDVIESLSEKFPEVTSV